MVKRFTKALFAVILSVSLTITATAADISASLSVSSISYSYDAVNTLSSNGILEGLNDINFNLADNITYGEWAGLCSRAYKPFSEIPSVEDWNTFDWRVKESVKNTTFSDNWSEPITRDFACQLLLNFKGLPVLHSQYYTKTYSLESLGDITDGIFSGYMYGYILGYDDGTLHGSDLLTRERACIILYRSLYQNPSPEIPEPILSSKYDFQVVGYSEQDTAKIRLQTLYRLASLPEPILSVMSNKGYTLIVASPSVYSDMSADVYAVYGSTSGYFSSSDKAIVVKGTNLSTGTLEHEFGHFVRRHFVAEETLEQCFNEELSLIISLAKDDYASTSEEEFFAEAFMCYVQDENKMMQVAPLTYCAIEAAIKQMTKEVSPWQDLY